MRTLLQPSDFESIVERVNSLDGSETRLWGTMSESQMLEHCRKQIEMAIGKIPTKPLFPRPLQWLTKITFGYYIPWPKNLITAPEMVARSEDKLEIELEKLLAVVSAFVEAEKLYPHPIFGNLTKEDWGLIIYKHLDHHLRQFGS
ncbi:MAG: DUF1569 domain-containing protein [Flavobacteriales bacterium]|nr:DUF1569 domain-containing protein [Flavobacteriales bacterium]